MKKGRKRVRFTNEKKARSFAKKVNGQFNDCRHLDTAKSKFTVTFDKPKKYNKVDHTEFAPEDDRDFGYPNSYWK